MTPAETDSGTRGPARTLAGIAEPRDRSLTRALTLATVGAAAYGTWAALANADHGARAALNAGVTQAAMSFVTTFCLTKLGDWILRRFLRRSSQLAAASALTPVAIAAVLGAIHTLARTPNVIATILPSVIGGSLFCVAYVAASGARRSRGQ